MQIPAGALISLLKHKYQALQLVDCFALGTSRLYLAGAIAPALTVASHKASCHEHHISVPF